MSKTSAGVVKLPPPIPVTPTVAAIRKPRRTSMSTASSFGVKCEKLAQKQNDPQISCGSSATMRLLRYYGASIDPHDGVQMHSAHRQAMCKVELDISAKVQDRFAGRQAGCNLIRLWDEFDLLMARPKIKRHLQSRTVSIDTSSNANVLIVSRMNHHFQDAIRCCRCCAMTVVLRSGKA